MPGARTFAVTNPATGETLAVLADASAGDAETAIARASRALPAWQRLSAKAGPRCCGAGST